MKEKINRLGASGKFASIRNQYGLLIIFVLLILVFWISNPYFMTVANWSRILATQIVVGCVSIGAVFILIVDEFDISLGYMVGFILIVGGYLSKCGFGVDVVLPAMIVTGLVVGLINGFLTVVLKITSAIATLGLGIILYGITLALSNGEVLAINIPKEIISFAQGRLFNVPYPVYAIVVIGIALSYILEYTPFGKQLYATGGSERAAYLSGVKTKTLKILAFVIAGLFVSIAAIFLLGQASAANPQRGPEYLMSSYATVYLSVTVFKPGSFNMPGVLLAILLLGMGFNGLSLMGVPYWFEPVFYGIVLAVSVLFASKEARAAKAG
ncbi:MAG TPA: ABC transporter permease [Bacillota bacterium]|nr:ABC transporter permease [Bacillota bacterium]